MPQKGQVKKKIKKMLIGIDKGAINYYLYMRTRDSTLDDNEGDTMHLGINILCHQTATPEIIGAAIDREAGIDVTTDIDEPATYEALCALVSEVFEPVTRTPMPQVEPYEYGEGERRAIVEQIGREDAWLYNDLAALPVA